MPDILILGRNNLLAAQIAAGLLASQQQPITWILEDLDSCIVEELLASVHASLVRISDNQNPELKELQERLKVVQWQSEHAHGVKASEAWFIAGEHGPPGMPRSGPERDLREELFQLLADSGAQVFNYVGSIYSHRGGDKAQNGSLPMSPEGELAEFCAGHGIRHRFFLTSWLLGEYYLAHSSGGEIDLVLRALDEVIAEIQERSPEYFDFQALRILAPRNAAVNTVPMDRAVQLMLDLAAQDSTCDSLHYIVSAQETPWADFCELLSEVYGVSVLSVEDQGELNDIDRLLGHQWSGMETAWSGAPVAQYQSSSAAAELQMGHDLQASLLSSIREKQEQARTERNQRVSALPGKMQKRTIPRNGSDLTYYTAGTRGEYILALNAIGQPLDYWFRLIDVWVRRYRVIIWETRGLTLEKEALRLSDHVDDIDAVLRQEKIDSCHLVAWCTGPQAAVEFYARQPGSVRDMVFLSCAFRIAGHPEMETAYVRDLEALCQSIIDQPAMTGHIRRSLSAPPASNIDMEDDDSKNLAIQVLSLPNIHLRSSLLAPFRTETSTFNYAHQIIDLTTYHTLEHAASVQVPILLLGCERDQVADPAKSGVVAGLFSRTRHMELPGATHYSFYDRPELVASMMEAFFQESKASANRNVVVEVAQ